jgi:anthranilate/para-aminobenzoate synthase component I
MKVSPGEDGTGVVEVEADDVPLALEGVAEAGIRLEAIPGRDVVIEDGDLERALDELAERLGGRRDVDEDELVSLEIAGAQRVLVAPGDVARLVSPGLPDRPRRTEAVGTARVIHAHPIHATRVADRAAVVRGDTGSGAGAGLASPASRSPMHTACAVQEARERGKWSEWIERLRGAPLFWWLDSAQVSPRLGRYSYAGADPYLVLRGFGECTELEVRRAVRPDLAPGRSVRRDRPLEALRALLPPPPSAGEDPRFPFLGGAVGYFGYEMAAAFEPVALRAMGDLALPDLCWLFVDRLLAYDHLEGRIRSIGLGFAAEAGMARERAKRAAARPLPSAAPGPPPCRCAAPGGGSVSFDREGYLKAIARAKRHIEAGDVYQVCLTRRSGLAFAGDPWRLYRRLRECNPAPFAAYLALGDVTLLSCSPERFLSLSSDRWVESRPIKGTRPRGEDPVSDRAERQALRISEKDRAENLMIVDLVRNDLGRVCEIGSVQVPELMAIDLRDRLPMVSTVRGRREATDVRSAPGRYRRVDDWRIGSAMESRPPRAGAARHLSGALGLDLRGGGLCVVIRTSS